MIATAGLCATCVHMRRITSARGSIFVLCERSRFDPAYPRYPRLPVLACAGFEREDADVPPGRPPSGPRNARD